MSLLLNMLSAAAAAAKSLQSCPTVQPHRQQPIRLPRPWDSPGKNTGVGCHFQCMKVKSESEVAQLCSTLSDSMDCSPPGSSIHGIFQATVLELGCHCLLQLSCSVMSNSLQPHGLQHARLPCPLPSSGACLKPTSIESVMPSNHLILCHPLLLLPSICPSIRVFSNESVLQVTKFGSWISE